MMLPHLSYWYNTIDTMKHCSLFITMLVLAFSLPVLSENITPTKRDWAQLDRYADSNAELRAQKKKVKVVFYGNSITFNWNKIHPSFFLSHDFVCRGISGQTSSELLVRFRPDVIDLHPRTVVILCGINDIAQNNGAITLEHVMGNIISMCELAKRNRIRPVLCSVLPAQSFYWNPSITFVPEQVIALNGLIRDYANKNHIPYVDYYSSMVNQEGGMREELTKDGVHPTSNGYDIMEPLVLKLLKMK